MDFRLRSVQDYKHLPCDYCLVQRDDFDGAIVVHVVVEMAAADDGVAIGDYDCACVHWSLLLNGYCCETRWNDSLTVRCGFGDSLHCVLADRVRSHNDMTFHLDSYSAVNVVQNAVTEFPDCLWPCNDDCLLRQH